MPEDKQGSGKGPFIPAELRPPVGADLVQALPLEPGASQEEIQRRASEVMDEAQRVRLGLTDGVPLPAMWKIVFTKSPDVEWTVLEKEAVLLNLETGAYFTFLSPSITLPRATVFPCRFIVAFAERERASRGTPG